MMHYDAMHWLAASSSVWNQGDIIAPCGHFASDLDVSMGRTVAICTLHLLVGGFNPSEKYAQVKLDHFPK